MTQRPRIGLLGIMQELYDDMIPGITEHQAKYAAEVAARLEPVAEVLFTRPARNQEDIEAVARELVSNRVDGIMIVMLTYGPAMRTVRALMETPVPLLLDTATGRVWAADVVNKAKIGVGDLMSWSSVDGGGDPVHRQAEYRPPGGKTCCRVADRRGQSRQGCIR